MVLKGEVLYIVEGIGTISFISLCIPDLYIATAILIGSCGNHIAVILTLIVDGIGWCIAPTIRNTIGTTINGVISFTTTDPVTTSTCQNGVIAIITFKPVITTKVIGCIALDDVCAIGTMNIGTNDWTIFPQNVIILFTPGAVVPDIHG